MTDDTNLTKLERAVDVLLVREGSLTPERIRELIGSVRLAPIFMVSDEEAEHLARRLETRHDITMNLGAVLTERDYKPWLESALADIDFYYWDRYRQLLESKQIPSQVIGTLHEDTNRTLRLLEDPSKEGPWGRRGMVVGHVQSGKTANYIGLICKAADAGYRLIVVIAGVHNNLRNQTQKRIDEGFVGRDSARLLSQREESVIGVGRFDPRRRPVTFTNSVKDFSKEMATGVGVPLHNLNEPAVFVIKKHSSTLRNLLEWLREHNASRGGKTVDAPMLLIDDEADNASINVKYGKGEVTRINGQIRELLTMFARSCYVGYTATPFANIFIDPDTDDQMLGADLFPRHFIVSLDPPSNYFGPERVFHEAPRAIVRHIMDSEDRLPLRHTKEHLMAGLPESLAFAVRTFVVGRAIRLIRGQQREHCSMLINASRFTGMHGQIRGAVQALVDDIRASVRLNGALSEARALRDPELGGLRQVWAGEFAGAGYRWPEVQAALLEAVGPVKVVEVNSRSSGTLNYDEYADTGLNVIAIGGYSLSRGLTLEGLMVSYFLRNSMMYDTLMQMGRWFGYRDGYDDLCRVWLPEEAEGWYAHIAESIEELRAELRLMAAAGATPEEFGLKVRAHPDTLIVTARNKMGAGEQITWSVGLDNKFVETAVLRNDSSSRAANRDAAVALGESLRRVGRPLTDAIRVERGWLLQDVPVAPIRSFLATFTNHTLSLLTDPGPIGRYIGTREDSELGRWDVLIASVADDDATDPDESLGLPVVCQRRTAAAKSDAGTLRLIKARVASRGVEKTGLSLMAVIEAEAAYRRASGKKEGDRVNYPDLIYRRRRERPLLVVHLLRIDNPDEDKTPMHEEPVVAWSISFPQTHLPENRVEYVVTPTWIRENTRDADDDELMSDDL